MPVTSVTTIFVIVTTCLSTVSTINFPINNLEINIPIDNSALLRDVTILQAQVTGDEGNFLKSGSVHYKLNNFNDTSVFTLDTMNGVLKLEPKVFQKDFFKGKTKSYLLEIQAEETLNNASALIKAVVKLEKIELVSCDSIPFRDLCFWRQAKFEVMENRRNVILGTPGPLFYRTLCPEYTVKYTILKGGENVTLEKLSNKAEWIIKTKGPFERDNFPNTFHRKHITEVVPQLNITLQCIISVPNHNNVTVREMFPVHVLDEDDNPPIPQVSTVDFYLHDAIVKQGSTLDFKDQLFINDKDSPDVNNYKIELLHDKEKLLNFSYQIFENDHQGDLQTFIRIEMKFAKSTRIKTTPYIVVLKITDTTMLPGFGPNSVNITVRIHVGIEPPAPASLLITEPPSKLYPSHNVNILYGAAKFARLTQPDQDASTTGLIFSVRGDTSSGAFRVTRVGGIVYVEDVLALRNIKTNATLIIEWKKPNGGIDSDTLYIHIVHELVASSSAVECAKRGPDTIAWLPCADAPTADQCHKLCGLGTGGSSSVLFKHSVIKRAQRCTWRGSHPSTSTAPPNVTMYNTCTPDLVTCPNHVCDPLEELHINICPQDCAEEILLGTRNENGRGIYSGRGVCTCIGGQCICTEHVDKPGKKKKGNQKTTLGIVNPTTSTAMLSDSERKFIEFHRENEIAKTQNDEGSSLRNTSIVQHYKNTKYIHTTSKGNNHVRCSTSCLVGIASGGILLLAAIGGGLLLVSSRLRHRWGTFKTRERKYTSSVNALHQQQWSEYSPPAVPPSSDPSQTLLLNFDMTTSLTRASPILSLGNKYHPDPKWEFARTNLHVEQTLGEGEFGRVLKAKALDISGIPGYTTVAVKTIKDGARESELDALLSEYELLKDVAHPNVIRLLGASTLPGGPVYVIIEYAEHGSLRNYLRQSRHLDTNIGAPNTAALLEGEEDVKDSLIKKPEVPKVTPKDIISFAWQICKGMSYLNDMKLVHRDLAARNVLLGSGKICKISDFGLTRDVYEDDAYLKRSKGRVPVKWMAPESLADHVYTGRSDVWSFGVLLWELVTLGSTPYPGIAVQNLFHLLHSGYRMERPDNCSQHLYEIMVTCWQLEPSARPSFRALTERFERMLSDGIVYLDLEPQRIAQNRAYFEPASSNVQIISDTTVNIDPTRNYKNLPLKTSESINLIDRSDNDPIKCAEVDKLPLWESPELVVKTQYENDTREPPQATLVLNHYESPIKIRNKSVLITPTNERPQSYIDMARNMNGNEIEDLVPSKSEEILESNVSKF